MFTLSKYLADTNHLTCSINIFVPNESNHLQLWTLINTTKNQPAKKHPTGSPKNIPRRDQSSPRGSCSANAPDPNCGRLALRKACDADSVRCRPAVVQLLDTKGFL